MPFIIVGLMSVSACTGGRHIAKAPELTPALGSREHQSMQIPAPTPQGTVLIDETTSASLWRKDKQSLLGDRRALNRGDILTVLIDIDDQAEMSSSRSHTRSSATNMSVPNLIGIPQRIDTRLPDGANLANAVVVNSSSSGNGNGSLSRREALNLQIAATVIDVLENGTLYIEGTQEVRVDQELRELTVSGFVRPADIMRQNAITFDKIASARISYSGRGQTTDAVRPRTGQQILDTIIPF